MSGVWLPQTTFTEESSNFKLWRDAECDVRCIVYSACSMDFELTSDEFTSLNKHYGIMVEILVSAGFRVCHGAGIKACRRGFCGALLRATQLQKHCCVNPWKSYIVKSFCVRDPNQKLK